MPVCPDCRDGALDLAADGCELCGWRLEREDGIPLLVSTGDKESAILAAYMELYERIAADDLADNIQGDDQLELEADRVLAELGELRGLAVCEVGVGRGILFERIRERSPRLLVGLDLAMAYLRRFDGQDGSARVVRANAENIPFSAELDAIVASDVLEHVLNAADFLASAHDALRPGGRLVVKVPYREDISQYRGSTGCPYPFVHLRTFDRALLKQTLEDAGFEVERLSYSGFYMGRWQPPIDRWPPVQRLLARALERRFGGDPGVNRIDPRIGRLLMRPVTIIVSAARPARPAGGLEAAPEPSVAADDVPSGVAGP